MRTESIKQARRKYNKHYSFRVCSISTIQEVLLNVEQIAIRQLQIQFPVVCFQGFLNMIKPYSNSYCSESYGQYAEVYNFHEFCG